MKVTGRIFLMTKTNEQIFFLQIKIRKISKEAQDFGIEMSELRNLSHIFFMKNNFKLKNYLTNLNAQDNF